MNIILILSHCVVFCKYFYRQNENRLFFQIEGGGSIKFSDNFHKKIEKEPAKHFVIEGFYVIIYNSVI